MRNTLYVYQPPNLIFYKRKEYLNANKVKSGWMISLV